jgi:hypothetical protein
MRCLITIAAIALGLTASLAETPGEFRPQPVLHPTEKVGATGQKLQPPDSLPKSKASLQTSRRKIKLNVQAEPTLLGNDLIFNAGWEMVEAPRVSANGAALSVPGVDTRDWYDATVPGTVFWTEQSGYSRKFE